MGRRLLSFFFFNDTATTEIYTLSLHDALPISMKEAGIFWVTFQKISDNNYRFKTLKDFLGYAKK